MPVLERRASTYGAEIAAAAPRQSSHRAPTCAAPGCKVTWLGRLRARAHVSLDGRKLCSTACAESYFQNVLLRQHNLTARPEPHRHRIPLGLVMLAQGWITAEQLQHALRAQRESRDANGSAGRIGYFLDQQGVANEDRITRALGLQWNCPVFDLRHPVPAIATWMPPVLARTYRCVPLRKGPLGGLLLAFDGVLDAKASYAVQHIHGTDVVPGLLPESAFERALDAYSHAAAPKVEEWGPELRTGLARKLARWLFHDTALSRASHVKSVTLHRHLWLRNVDRGRELVVEFAA